MMHRVSSMPQRAMMRRLLRTQGKEDRNDSASSIAEHAALGIDTVGHEWAWWMGVQSVFLFFSSFNLDGGSCLKSAKKGQFMSATRLGIVSNTTKILLLLLAYLGYLPFLRVLHIFIQLFAKYPCPFSHTSGSSSA